MIISFTFLRPVCTKAGQKGTLMKLFDYDSSFMRFMSLLSRITLINILWFICCIPIVTIGASTMAQHYSVNCLIDGNYSVFSSFKKGFKLHWKRATIVWLILAVLSVAFFVAYQMLGAMDLPGKEVPIALAVLAFITLIIFMLWVFPVMLHFNGSLPDQLFNAFIFAFKHAPTSILAVILYGVAGFLLTSSPLTSGLCVLFGESLIVYITMNMFKKVFRKYIPEEPKEN